MSLHLGFVLHALVAEKYKLVSFADGVQSSRTATRSIAAAGKGDASFYLFFV